LYSVFFLLVLFTVDLSVIKESNLFFAFRYFAALLCGGLEDLTVATGFKQLVISEGNITSIFRVTE
jgi:hypothetical protein